MSTKLRPAFSRPNVGRDAARAPGASPNSHRATTDAVNFENIRIAGLAATAKAATQGKDWALALQMWDACLEASPDHSNAGNWKGSRAQALMNLGRFAEAEAAAHALHDDSSRKPIVLAALARSAQNRGKWSLALRCWNACLDAASNHSNAGRWQSARAQTLMRLGRATEAESIVSALPNDSPYKPTLLEELARLAQKQNKWRVASQRWDACIRSFPDHANSGGWRGARALAFEKSGAWQDAFEAWDALAGESEKNR